MMVVNTPIPSHILIGGVKVKISYQGQARTCGRCYKYWSSCPGGGKAAVCKAKAEAANKEKEEAGGKAVKPITMKQHFKKLEKKLEKKMKDGSAVQNGLIATVFNAEEENQKVMVYLRFGKESDAKELHKLISENVATL